MGIVHNTDACSEAGKAGGAPERGIFVVQFSQKILRDLPERARRRGFPIKMESW